MKRLFAFMMVMAMVLSLSVTAFADNEETGSITITNATVGQSYAPYKIFDASISGGEEGGYTYSITTNNQFFETMFGDPTDENNKFDQNPFFNYDPNSGAVTKKDGVDNNALLKYLKLLVYNEIEENDDKGNKVYRYELKTGLTPDKEPIVAKAPASGGDVTVVFDELDYGYYMITSTLGTTVTIDSTNPNVKVIDKNQKPGDNFDKLVWDEDVQNPDGTTGAWVKNSSAAIGDIVDFKVQFNATNYNGEKLIKHYTIGDNKGDALWVEFNSIEVTVNGKSVGKGWYHCTNDDDDLNLNTGEWTNKNNPEQWAATANEAGWYLIHNGYDDFDIIIPWLEDHTFTPDGEAFELKYPEKPESKYPSPAEVVIKYNASVEPTANIEGKSNLFNEADLSWKDDTVVTHPDTPKTDLTIHAIGITKIDGNDSTVPLSGALFEIYKTYDADAESKDLKYSDPVYVIPTNIPGVYILDDLNTVVSGDNRESSREKYAAYLSDYFRKDGDLQRTQDNYVVTQENGKLVILGLEKGTYYLKEAVAPSGYNKLTAPVIFTVDKNVETEEYSFTFKNANDEDETKEYGKVISADVKNFKGAQLPSTGGEGTIKMITIGTVIALAFAVLLITHKKMTVYQD